MTDVPMRAVIEVTATDLRTVMGRVARLERAVLRVMRVEPFWHGRDLQREFEAIVAALDVVERSESE